MYCVDLGRAGATKLFERYTRKANQPRLGSKPPIASAPMDGNRTTSPAKMLNWKDVWFYRLKPLTVKHANGLLGLRGVARKKQRLFPYARRWIQEFQRLIHP